MESNNSTNLEQELKSAAKCLAEWNELKGRFIKLANEDGALPAYASIRLRFSPSAVTPTWLFNVIKKMAQD